MTMIVKASIPMGEYKFSKNFRANLLLELPDYARSQFFMMENGIRDRVELAKRLKIPESQVVTNDFEIKKTISLLKEKENLPSMKEIIIKMLVEEGRSVKEISQYRFCTESYLYAVKSEYVGSSRKMRNSSVRKSNAYDSYKVEEIKREYDIVDKKRRLKVTEVSDGKIVLSYNNGSLEIAKEDLQFVRYCLLMIERKGINNR